MELNEAKITAMVGLGLGTLLVGLLPALFSPQGRRQWPLFLSSLLCFGGGVLMSTSIIHMLPMIRETMPKFKEYSELIFCAGFFIVYIIDEMVHFFYGDSHEHHDTNSNANGHQHHTKKDSLTYQRTPGYGSTEAYSESSYRQAPYNLNYSTSSRTDGTDNRDRKCIDPCNRTDDQAPSQLCHVGHQEPCDASPIGNVGLLIALSIHSLLEGLAIGLQRSSSQVLLLLGAVASHKLVVGFCLGVELATTLQSTCRHLLLITIFSLGSVIGIGTGMIIHEIPEDVREIAFPILQGLAAGTLLYVTVCEVLPRERARWHKEHRRRIAGLVQLAAVALGFVIMTFITIFLNHN